MEQGQRPSDDEDDDFKDALEESQVEQQGEEEERVENTSKPKMRVVKCVCSVFLELPEEVTVFQCSQCQQVMSIPAVASEPPPLTEEERKHMARRALNRWIVREAVNKELDIWLDGKETFASDSDSLVARFYRKLCEFPLFDDKESGIDQALLEFFLFLPKLEEKLVKMGDKRSTVRTRFVNYIAGPIFYASFGDDNSEEFIKLNNMRGSRGEKNDVFKTELVNLLREIEKPDGPSTILEAFESAHSIHEIPGAFGRMERAHLESAVANLEHSLAKPKSRSKIKSLYHLTPRRTIIKLMKMNMGGGLASTAVNIFMAKPFGRRSLMQRMAATTFGVNDAEDMAAFAAKHLSPEVKSRVLALLRERGTEEETNLYFVRDEEVLYLLESEELTERWGTPPVPKAQMDKLREAIADFAGPDTNMASSFMSALSNVDETSVDGQSTDGSDDDEDVDKEFDVSEGGDVNLKSDLKKQSRTRSLFKNLVRSESTVNREYHPLHYIRMFCKEEASRQTGEMIVELAGDESLEKVVRVSLPIIQKHLIDSVSAKGSGLIPLLEGLFVAWRDILKAHKNRRVSEERRAEAFRNVVEKIHELGFTLAHNLVRGDKNKKWHHLVYWLVDIWNSSRVNVDTDNMLAELSEADRALIETEAELLRQHHVENATRKLGSDRLPPPAIDASWKLVTMVRQRLLDGLFVTDAAKSEELKNLPKGQFRPKRFLPKRLQSFNLHDHELSTNLTQLEVVYSFENDSFMASRGYELIPIDFNLSSDVESRLWIRRSLPDHAKTLDGADLEWMKPITDIVLVNASETARCAELKAKRYTRIAKALDKQNLFIWYTRAPGQAIQNVTAVRLDSENAGTRVKALELSGYRMLDPVLTYKTGYFGFGSTLKIGVFVQRNYKR